MEKTDFISASIVTYNNSEKGYDACRAILRNTKRYELKLYVIDNASSDNTADLISSLEGVTPIRNKKNIGFGAAHNRVLKEDMGKYHFFINPDIDIKSDVLCDMADFFERNPDIVMAMPKILNTDGTEQKLPKEMPSFKRLFFGRLAFLGGVFRKIREDYTWSKKQLSSVTDIDFCSGCFFGMRADIFKSLGGFDEGYFMYLEDADLTLRARKAGRVVINPSISVTHKWERESAKSLKYLFIHICSSFRFLSRKDRIK